MGWFRPVHAKSIGSQEVRALLVARKQLLGRLIDVKLSIRGILRGFGLKIGLVTRKGFEERVRELSNSGLWQTESHSERYAQRVGLRTRLVAHIQSQPVPGDDQERCQGRVCDVQISDCQCHHDPVDVPATH